MAGISVSAESFLRKIGGGSGAGADRDARDDRRPAGGVAGRRLPVDEYIASLPSRAAFIGGKTLETLTSLPPVPQRKGQGVNGADNAGGVGIGINTIGRIGIGVDNNNAGGAGIGISTFNTVNTIDTVADEAVDEDDTEEADEAADEKTDRVADENDNAGVGTDRAAGELTPEEQGVVNELRNIDREVRAHEQAHVSAGGAYIRGGVSYQYQRGPDNKRYAVGGEVGIDTSPERDNPGATITKMQAVRAAALAPSDPSAQDRAVAAAAARNESNARADLAEEEKTI